MINAIRKLSSEVSKDAKPLSEIVSTIIQSIVEDFQQSKNEEQEEGASLISDEFSQHGFELNLHCLSSILKMYPSTCVLLTNSKIKNNNQEIPMVDFILRKMSNLTYHFFENDIDRSMAQRQKLSEQWTTSQSKFMYSLIGFNQFTSLLVRQVKLKIKADLLRYIIAMINNALERRNSTVKHVYSLGTCLMIFNDLLTVDAASGIFNYSQENVNQTWKLVQNFSFEETLVNLLQKSQTWRGANLKLNKFVLSLFSKFNYTKQLKKQAEESDEEMPDNSSGSDDGESGPDDRDVDAEIAAGENENDTESDNISIDDMVLGDDIIIQSEDGMEDFDDDDSSGSSDSQEVDGPAQEDAEEEEDVPVEADEEMMMNEMEGMADQMDEDMSDVSDEDEEQEEEEDENEGMELFQHEDQDNVERALRRVSNHRSQMQNLFNRISQDTDQLGDIESMLMGMNHRMGGLGDNDLIIQQPEDNDNPFANINIQRQPMDFNAGLRVRDRPQRGLAQLQQAEGNSWWEAEGRAQRHQQSREEPDVNSWRMDRRGESNARNRQREMLLMGVDD